jgi:uncharacterized membrane protein YgdD (TMEM256/DUF423 family)
MKHLIQKIRSLKLWARLLLFLLVSSIVIAVVILIKPTDADAYANASKNQLWHIGTTFFIGFIAVLFFSRQRA